VLFQLVEKQGKLLYNMISTKCEDRKVFFVYGGTDTQQREEIRRITDSYKYGKLLTFGNKKILIPYGTKVLLADGSKKDSLKITTDDDINEKWLVENYELYKYL
jgi:hypothetical protein